jgi:cytochrome P450
MLPALLAGMRRDRLGLLDRIRRDVGPIARVPLLGIVFVSDAAAAQEILRDTVSFPDKGIGLSAARRYLGNGRLTATGAEWRHGHRRAAPFYTAQAMARMVASIGPALERSFSSVGPGPIALQPIIDRAIMTGLLTQLLGEDAAIRVDLEPILHDLRVLAMWSARRLSPRPPGWTRLAWLLSWRARQASRRLGDAIASWAGCHDGTLTELDGLDQASVRAETLTLLVAGLETSAATAAFAVEALSRSPRWADAIAVAGAGPLIARQAVLETLRLHPPVWAITRRSSRAIAVAGQKIRSGEQLLISVHGLHRDPGIWDDPSLFDPDRFADGNPPAAFMPFGLGIRQCAGRQAGVGEATALIAWLFSRYRVEPIDPPADLEVGLAQRPRHSRYRLTRR